VGHTGPRGATATKGLKIPRAGDETAEVMITVKTYPDPSETYGETVCVAGVRLDLERPEWIRLYPVKFRNAHFDNQFSKSGNQYDGMALVRGDKQINHNVPIQVTADGDQIMWQSPPRSFAWAALEQLPGITTMPQSHPPLPTGDHHATAATLSPNEGIVG
jgi:hypothetical protein